MALIADDTVLQKEDVHNRKFMHSRKLSIIASKPFFCHVNHKRV